MTKEQIIKGLKDRGITEGCEFWCSVQPDEKFLSGWTWDDFEWEDGSLSSFGRLTAINRKGNKYKDYAFLCSDGKYAKPVDNSQPDLTRLSETLEALTKEVEELKGVVADLKGEGKKEVKQSLTPKQIAIKEIIDKVYPHRPYLAIEAIEALPDEGWGVYDNSSPLTFTWCDSPQGQDYWEYIYEQYFG